MLVTWPFRVRNSPMEKIDPRARWIFSLLFLFSVTQYWDLRFLLVFFTIAAFWYSLARTPFRETRRGWTFVLFLMTMMIVVNTIITSAGAAGIVSGPGHELVSWSYTFPRVGWTVHFNLSIERLWFALCQAVRIISISSIFLIIPYSMDPKLYGFTFHGLGLPDRFAYAMDLAFRYVPTLGRDFKTTLDAQRARGFELERVEGGLITQVRRIAPLVVPVTIGSILAGEDITNAMDLRCFGLNKRTWVAMTFYHWYDFLLIAFGVVLLLGTLYVRYVLHLGAFWVPTWIIT